MKLSLETVKKLPPKVLLSLINRAKEYLKKQDSYKDFCKENNLEEDFIDLVPVKFGDLPVSARTEKGVITLNYKLLIDGDFFKDIHYLQHELIHHHQQLYSDKPTQSADDGNYLDNPYEEEAFKHQIEYIDEQFGENEAQKYVDHLLDHHKFNGKERKDKEQVLMERLDD